jgi:hypothetical protein
MGHLVELTVKGGELEVKSEPSGAKVFLDGKEVGHTPLFIPDVRSGRHQIQVVKEGYDPYEISEDIGSGRLKMFANLRRVVRGGELVVRTEPPGAMIYVNGKLVGYFYGDNLHNQNRSNFLSEFQIEGIEEITTPAGTFKAFKIFCDQSRVSPRKGSGWVRYWYAPAVKYWIKREVEKTSFWRGATWLQDAELISYELK